MSAASQSKVEQRRKELEAHMEKQRGPARSTLQVFAAPSIEATLDEQLEEISILEGVAKWWKVRFCQYPQGGSRSIWVAHDDAGSIKAVTHVERFKRKIDDPGPIVFGHNDLCQTSVVSNSLGVPLIILACLRDGTLQLKYDANSIPRFINDASWVSVGFRSDKGVGWEGITGVILKIPVDQFSRVKSVF